jgi:hypothetical protein
VASHLGMEIVWLHWPIEAPSLISAGVAPAPGGRRLGSASATWCVPLSDCQESADRTILQTLAQKTEGSRLFPTPSVKSLPAASGQRLHRGPFAPLSDRPSILSTSPPNDEA